MSGYTKLFSSIITSTIWGEDSDTKVVWITILALKDRNGEVKSTVPGLARLAGVPRESVDKAVAKFLAPDPDSRTRDFDGRRIQNIDGGWLVLNHEKYRSMEDKEDQKRATAERVARWRERQKEKLRVSSNVNSNGALLQVSKSNDISRVPEADTDTDTDTTKKEKKEKSMPSNPTVILGDISFPAHLDTPAFHATWNDWIAARKEIKKPLKPRAANMQLNALSVLTVENAIACIHASIANQWQGLFPDKFLASQTAAGANPKYEDDPHPYPALVRTEGQSEIHGEYTDGTPYTKIITNPAHRDLELPKVNAWTVWVDFLRDRYFPDPAPDPKDLNAAKILSQGISDRSELEWVLNAYVQDTEDGWLAANFPHQADRPLRFISPKLPRYRVSVSKLKDPKTGQFPAYTYGAFPRPTTEDNQTDNRDADVDPADAILAKLSPAEEINGTRLT